MNDLEIVRAMRADAPRPSSGQLAEGRARLRAAMDPGRRRRRSAMIISASASAAAVAAAAGIILLPAGGGATPPVRQGGSHPQAVLLSATVVLHNAAAAAAQRPAVLPGPHEWVYTKGIKEGPAGRGRFVIQGWERFDGVQSARIEHGRLVILPYGSAQDGDPAATPQGAASYLRSLPASPKALLALIYRKADGVPRNLWPVPGNRDSEAFSLLMTPLFNAPVGVPPAVQANVFRAAALIPGVHVSKILDVLGRPALALSGAGLNNGSFLLDPTSYALIGLQSEGASITRIAVAVVSGPGQR
jgi:hypothetical protein